ncbi:hypothetical protein [Salinicola avicenniae]|uniref:hypothetical protein n=1 Tax=Salinicola avicenniae TaxID=2916836 RepID=UPI00207469A9|nr:MULTISPECIES: hypothetical protein [unclassified Salinicola]
MMMKRILGTGSVLAGVLVTSLALAQGESDTTVEGLSAENETQAPANASQVDNESIETSGGVGSDNAGFTDGGAQTPVDQRPNALSFDQLDVNGDGVIDEDEAVSAEQQSMFQQLNDEAAGGVTRTRFHEAMGADTLSD